MAKHIREPKVRKLNIAKPKVRQLDPKHVAAALGAEATDMEVAGHPSPLSLFQLRRDIATQLRSSTSLSLSDTTLHKKIPMSEENWQELETLAEHLSADLSGTSTGRTSNITASQVASRLLHLALQEIHREVQENSDKPLVSALRKAVGE